MLSSVFTKAIQDRWLGMTIAVGTLSVWMFLAMAIYRDIDLSVYTDLPEAMRDLMGIPAGADAASLAYNVLLGFAAALTVAGMAVSMGSAAIAGEERDGTLGLLLGNPRSRTHVLASKTMSMILLVVLGVLALWGASRVVPSLLGVEIGDTRLAAMMLHLGVNSVFYGCLAVAVGAWTGRRSLASGVAGITMVVSYVAVGLLPLVPGLADGARLFPWYYFDGSQPLVNGVAWDHLGVLGGGIVVLCLASLVGVNRRDLRGPAVGRTVLDRLRAHPLTDQIFDRLAGTTRVSRPWVKTASAHQGLLVIIVVVMFLVMGVLMGPMYAAIDQNLDDLAASFPEEILALAGGGDLSTPEGWYQAETFSLMAPIAVMTAAIVIAVRGIAGEEQRRTMGLLLANPIRRSRLVLEQALAMVVYAGAVGLSIFLGVSGGNAVSGLGMSLAGIAAAATLVTLLGLAFGMLALVLSAATGKGRVAVSGTIGAALTSYLLDALLPLTGSYAAYAKWTPNHYFLSSDPLNNGMAWGHALLLASISLVLLFVAVVAFERRDIR